MWKEKLLTSLYSLNKLQIASIALFFLGIILFGGGLIYSLRSSSDDTSEDIKFESGSTSLTTGAQANEQKVTVDVEGAVVNPGVYNLTSNSRVKDALISAGGLSSDADRNWVEKNLNLALKISDGSKIYVPRIGEQVQSASSNSPNSTLININSATLSELDGLSGVGPVTAQKIIDGRPYSSIEDLRSKKIVGQSVFEKIKDKISIY